MPDDAQEHEGIRVSIEQNKAVRTSIKLPPTVNRNVEFYSTAEGLSKNDAFVRLVSDGLVARGYRPDKFPTLAYSES